MSWISKLFNKKKDINLVDTPEGYCPNCWGDQEYGNIIREKLNDSQINVNNHNEKYAFIQDFIVTNLNGIKLKSSVHGKECPTCKVKSI